MAEIQVGKVAVVTGANKGVGLAIVRGLCKEFEGDVYLTSRNEDNGRRALATLEAEGLRPKFHQLDIDCAKSIEAMRQHLLEKYGGVDVLVNNAAWAYRAASTVPFLDQAKETVNINFKGTLNLSNALMPMLRPNGRIVNVSSGISSLSLLSEELQERIMKPTLTEEELVGLIDEFIKGVAAGNHTEKGWPHWPNAVSKHGVNALTRIHAREMAKSCKENILINACCPGWVRTDMADDNAPLTPDQGAETPIHLAMLPPWSPNGQFWIDKRVVEWENVCWTYYDPKEYKW